MSESFDDRTPLQRLHHGESAQWDALRWGDEPSRRARFSASQRPRFAVHLEYAVTRLVWYEHHADVNEAIAREKQLKKWERRWKLDLIESVNPGWADLYETLNT
jgi:predicted GIY-YIG superfamily endonuclease